MIHSRIDSFIVGLTWLAVLAQIVLAIGAQS